MATKLRSWLWQEDKQAQEGTPKKQEPESIFMHETGSLTQDLRNISLSEPQDVRPSKRRIPDYPDLPLESVASWPFGTMINLKYPGLQLVHRGCVTGAPIFVVNDFLSEDECEALLRKFNHGQEIEQNEKQRAIKVRTSTHIRLVKEETAHLQQKIAQLTNHPVKNMETIKIARYTRGAEFNRHSDQLSMPDSDDYKVHVKTMDGKPAPCYVNREVTVFAYLKDCERGGETAFYHEWETDVPFLKLKPKRGMAAVFYPTMQPADVQHERAMAELADSGKIHVGRRATQEPKKDGTPYAFCTDDTRHAGLPAIDEKFLLAQWIWPVYVDRDESLPGRFWLSSREHRATDGIVV